MPLTSEYRTLEAIGSAERLAARALKQEGGAVSREVIGDAAGAILGWTHAGWSWDEAADVMRAYGAPAAMVRDYRTRSRQCQRAVSRVASTGGAA